MFRPLTLVTPKPDPLVEQYGSPRFLGSPLVPLPCSRTPAAPALLCHSRTQVLPPLRKTTKAAAFNRFSRLHHTASALAVYASSFGFPYTGKTRFRWVANPCRMGFEPIGLQSEFHVWWLSHTIPTLQAWPGAICELCVRHLFCALFFSIFLPQTDPLFPNVIYKNR